MKKQLKYLLNELNLSQKDLAKRTGLTQASVSMIIGGEREPSLKSLVKISDALNCSTDYLVGKEGVPDKMELWGAEAAKLSVEDQEMVIDFEIPIFTQDRNYIEQHVPEYNEKKENRN